MKITIHRQTDERTKKLEAIIRANLEKFEKLYLPIIEAQVNLKSGNGDPMTNCVADIRVVIPGNDLFASKEAETFELATNLCLDAIKHQIDRLRTKWGKQRAAKRR